MPKPFLIDKGTNLNHKQYVSKLFRKCIPIPSLYPHFATKGDNAAEGTLSLLIRKASEFENHEIIEKCKSSKFQIPKGYIKGGGNTSRRVTVAS